MTYTLRSHLQNISAEISRGSWEVCGEFNQAFEEGAEALLSSGAVESINCRVHRHRQRTSGRLRKQSAVNGGAR